MNLGDIKQKFKIENIDFLGIVILFIIFTQWALASNLNVDSMFLYNRAYNMLSCIKEYIYPYFYYKDFHGVGYGSSFFYGQLTLIPFLPFVYNINVFIKVYYLVDIILNYIGVCYFSKRFTKNYRLIAILYITSNLYLSYIMYCNRLAVGISWFFLAKCIDYFRDKRDFYPASILFFLILNTHILTTIFSFIMCICIMIYYFDKLKIKSYFQFALFTIIICSYNILNFLWHFGDFVNIDVKSTVNDSTYHLTFSNIPFLSTFIEKYLYVVTRFNTFRFLTIVSLSVFVFCVFNFVKSKTNFLKKTIWGICLLSFILGINDIWQCIISKLNVFFYFPSRYMLYTLVLFLIISLQNVEIKKSIKTFILCVCVFDLIFGMSNVQHSADLPENDIKKDYTIMSGEYLYKDFIFNTDLFNELSNNATVVGNNEKLIYQTDKNKFILFVPKHDKFWTIRIPKLYYKGYKTNVKEIKPKMGYSQFIELDVGKYNGRLEIYYEHPKFLILVQLLNILFFLLSFVYKIYEKDLTNL